jgi:hypothetical protein
MITTSSMQVRPGSRAVLAASVSSLPGFAGGRDRGDGIPAIEDPADQPDPQERTGWMPCLGCDTMDDLA